MFFRDPLPAQTAIHKSIANICCCRQHAADAFELVTCGQKTAPVEHLYGIACGFTAQIKCYLVDAWKFCKLCTTEITVGGCSNILILHGVTFLGGKIRKDGHS